MKKHLLFVLSVLLITLSAGAQGLADKRIYINPGHGTFGPNDRPMATIPYPNIQAVVDQIKNGTNEPDTVRSFFESNTNYWKGLELQRKLEAAGATTMISHKLGTSPALSAVCEEVEANNIDFFISIHSNAASEGTTTNYPLILYRGYDDGTGMAEDSKERGRVVWPYLFEAMGSGIDPFTAYGKNNPNVRGDLSFYGSGSTGALGYEGYLGVLKHGAAGFLSEGYFHTYQPARHRALNPDYCKQEGIRYYRGIAEYYKQAPETKGYIMGTVKDLHEKIVNKLFTYTPKTNDQWLPLNGAVVTLYKGGKKVADYTVDNCYNGLFYFPDLEPGTDYTLDATCEGYKPLTDDYKAPLTVKANETTYPMIYMESTTYEPPKVVYVDYPDYATNAYDMMPASLCMENKGTQTYEAIEGTVKRTLFAGDSLIVLSHTEDGTPHLYLINNLTNELTALSLNGIKPRDTENKGDHLSLSDIALTCDGKLLGCNYIETQFDDSQVNNADHTGYKRGTLQIYKWETLSADPVAWVSTKKSANLFNADAGKTMTVYGSSEDCNIIVSASSFWGNRKLWKMVLNVAEDKMVSDAFYCNGPMALDDTGDNCLFQLSPRGNKQHFVVDAELITPMELSPKASAQPCDTLGIFPEEHVGTTMNATSYFVYAGKSIMVAPYTNAEGKVAGVRLFDVTNGFDAPVQIKTTGTDLEIPVAATSAFAGVKVNGYDFIIYLQTDNAVTVISSVGVEQPVVRHIGAYDLKVVHNEAEKTYTISYMATDNAVATSLVFYQEGEEMGKLPIQTAVKGENSVTINATDIIGYSGTPTNWAIELQGEVVPTWGTIYADKSMGGPDAQKVRNFNAIDNSPESDFFGRLYVMHRLSSNNEGSGLYIYDQEMNRQNETTIKGNHVFGNPVRLACDAEGYVYMADWGDGASGVYIMNPATTDADFVNFFKGTRNSAGVISNNGQDIGSSTPSVFVYGTGADTRLFVYNEDGTATLPTNGVCVYNIGQEDGSIVRSWDKAPSATYTLQHQANTEGNIWATSHGFFNSQVRGAGNNNSSAASLVFYDYEGNKLMTSFQDEYKDIIDGSAGGGYAVSADESMLILNDGSKNFLVFDITWEGNKPVLALRYSYEHGLGYIRQMNFDYAGNLICTGESGLHIFAMPTEKNITTVPAKTALVIEKPSDGKVEGVKLDKTSAKMVLGEILTLKATVMPRVATNQEVSWTSSNEKVATVKDGVITTLAVGETTITVTTAEGNFTATCEVSVTVPVTGVRLTPDAAEIMVGKITVLQAVIEPANAVNKKVTWASSDEKIATVSNGIVTGVGVGEATITVTTEEGNFSASAKITVKPVPVESVVLDKASLDVEVAQTATLVATVKPDNATNKKVLWSSDNEAIATVTDGVVTGIAVGEATITVTTEDGGFTATSKITVLPISVESVALDRSTLELEETQTATLVATVLPENAANKKVLWSSNNGKVATVADGVVTAVSEGEATIMVTTEDGGFTATCEVTVTKTPDGLMNIAVDGIYYNQGTIYNSRNIYLWVYSATGQLVASGNTNIDMSGAAQGVYVVRTANATLKFVR